MLKNGGEYLINVLNDDADIVRIKEFVEGYTPLFFFKWKYITRLYFMRNKKRSR